MSAGSWRSDFRAPDSTIRVIVATTTLAQGVNMPAETVVIPELQRADRRERVQVVPGGRVQEHRRARWTARPDGARPGHRVGLSRGDADPVLVAVHQWRPGGHPLDAARPDADMYTLVLARGRRGLTADRAPTTPCLKRTWSPCWRTASPPTRTAWRAAATPSSRRRSRRSWRTCSREQFIEDNGKGLRLTPLGRVVADSGLAVRSAVAVAERLPAAPAAAAQPGHDHHRRPADRGTRRHAPDRKCQGRPDRRSGRSLSGAGAAAHGPGSLGGAQDQRALASRLAARAKKAVACLLWMNGMPAAQLEATGHAALLRQERHRPDPGGRLAHPGRHRRDHRHGGRHPSDRGRGTPRRTPACPARSRYLRPSLRRLQRPTRD